MTLKGFYNALAGLFARSGARPEIVSAEETSVFRGGRHARNRSFLFCPKCWTTTAHKCQCLNRACEGFNGRLASTHPDLLSLDRGVRMRAIDRWNRGGAPALWAA